MEESPSKPLRCQVIQQIRVARANRRPAYVGSDLCQAACQDGRESQALLALAAASKDEVDATIAKGVAAGGRADPDPPQDFGFMYNRQIEDPDGNVWEFIWMNPAAMP